VCAGTRELIVSAGDGSVARVDRKEMKIIQETKLGGGVLSLGVGVDRVFAIGSNSIVYGVDRDDIGAYHEHILSTHNSLIRQIVFPK